jgi:predicted N-acetyltransferase YhbS
MEPSFAHCDEGRSPRAVSGVPPLRRADAPIPPAIRGISIESAGPPMPSDKAVTRPELSSDDSAVEALHRAAFGPGAYARAAFRVREQAPHDRTLSFLTELDGVLVASVRMTPIDVGGARGLLLGPLVVDPPHKGQGYGKALMRHVMEEARKAGSPFVILVGDQPYYWPFGFRPLPPGRVTMPGPVDPARLLAAELKPGAAEGLAGMITGVLGLRSGA